MSPPEIRSLCPAINHTSNLNIMKNIILSVALLAAINSASSAIIITEFMANPAALTDATGEYFEVYNSGPTPVAVGTLSLSDDGTNSIDLIGATEVIPVDTFFVFGISALPYVDFNYGGLPGNFALGNGADEIVVSVTATGAELARLNYTNGDPFGEGVAAVLDDVESAMGGVTTPGSYVAEIAANNTIGTSDIGSPGVAGLTVVPEPSSALLGALGIFGFLVRRSR